MKIKQAEFISSCTRVADKPKRSLPEFAFIGRSNVGKSSLINCLCGRQSLAHTSSTPGKTQCINYFLANDSFYIVDLPGYGYAQMSQKRREQLKQMIEDYVLRSPDMVLLFVLLDSRHKLLKNDLEFLQMLGTEQVPFSIVFTKGDKLGKNALITQIDGVKTELLEYWEELPAIFITSSETGMGKEEILTYIDQIINTLATDSK
ncbi:MAG: YihA family ribosome biogenesis GTP-binding protein [Bacteroidales bacterium]|nr:YihA family ribosome biogenesis GTP-binding protein [Bacteroidales bacterium]